MAGSDWFGTASLATKYGIIISGLILLSFGVAFIKVGLNRRKLKQHTAALIAAEEARAQQIQTVRTVEYGEGDLFGVRAIQKGYYGGVTQSPDLSRPETPVRSRKSLVRSILKRLSSMRRQSRNDLEADSEARPEMPALPLTAPTADLSRSATPEPKTASRPASTHQVNEHAPLHAVPHLAGSAIEIGSTSITPEFTPQELERPSLARITDVSTSIPDFESVLTLSMRKRSATNGSEMSIKSAISTKSRGGSPFFRGDHGRTRSRSRSIASRTRLRSMSNAESQVQLEEIPQLPPLNLPFLAHSGEVAEIQPPALEDNLKSKSVPSNDEPPEQPEHLHVPVISPPVQVSERIQEKITAARKLISTVNTPEPRIQLSDRIQKKIQAAKQLISSVEAPNDGSRRSTTHSIASAVSNSVFTPALSRHSPGLGPSTISEFSFDSAEDGDLQTPRESFKVRAHARMRELEIPAIPMPASLPISRNSTATRTSSLSRSRTRGSEKDQYQTLRAKSVVSQVLEIESSPTRSKMVSEALTSPISPTEPPFKRENTAQESPFFQDFPTPTDLTFDPKDHLYAKPLKLLQLEQTLEQAFPSPIEPYWPQMPQPAHTAMTTIHTHSSPARPSDSSNQIAATDPLEDVYDTYWNTIANRRVKRDIYDDGPSPTAMIIGPPLNRAGRPAFRPNLNNVRRAPSSNYRSRWTATGTTPTKIERDEGR